MAKTVRVKIFGRERNPKKKPLATFSISGPTLKKAVSRAKSFLRKRLKNVEQGFYAGGIFHPIRASADYSGGRAGEGRSKRARQVRGKQHVRRMQRKGRRGRHGAIT